MLSEQERSQGRDRRAQIYDARARESQQHAQILRELQVRRQTDHPSQ